MNRTIDIGIAAWVADESRVRVPASYYLARPRVPTPMISTRPEAET